MTTTRRVLLAGAGIALAIAFSAGFASAQDDWAKVVAAAKAEGKLIVYSAYVGAPSTKAVAKAFETKYGIQIETLESRASEQRERIRTEHAAGRFAADLMFTSPAQAGLQNAEDKVVEQLPTLPSIGLMTGKFKADSVFLPTTTLNYGILINTTLVKPEDEPKSWKDLADPKWKGKILADDPRAIGGGYLTMLVHHETPALGLAYVEAYAAQGPTLTRDQRQSQQRVARGEFAIYTPFILNDYNRMPGLPVKHIIPSEGVPYVLYGYSLLKNAPHPNAARLYMDFILSEEAQLIWAREGHGSVSAGIADKIPAEVRPISSASPLGTSNAELQNKMLELAKKLFK
jgi:iron(III) transport system substrate-binding protein